MPHCFARWGMKIRHVPEMPFSRPENVLSTLLTLLAQAAPAVDDRPFAVRFFDNPLLLPVGLVVIFYITFWLPERRRKAEEAKLLASITKNDRVVTTGGIHAVVVAASPGSDVVTLKIDEAGNTRVKVNRSAIASVVPRPAANERPNAKTDADASKSD